jgi:hypothetical protein
VALTSESHPLRCRVWTTDPKRGTATLITDKGLRIRLSYDVVKDAPVLLRGMNVLVHLDQMGMPTKVRVA